MLRPLFSYYGSKWRIAKRYPAPEHQTIVEPFAGAAGYSLRHHQHDVILIEINPIVAGVWSYLTSARESEILRLPLLEPFETVDDKQWPCNEAKDLVGFWLNRGTVAPRKRHTAMAVRHWDRKPGSRWGEQSRARVARQVSMINHWRVICGSYKDAPDVAATWFVDPPYQQAGKHYPHGSHAIDYDDLASYCRDRQGLAIVCENTGATWLPFGHLCAAKAMRKGRPSQEAVWVQRA